MNLILGLIVLAVALLVISLPVSWLVMLFLGNLGVNVSYWGAIPGAVIIALLGGSGVSPAKRNAT